MKLNKHIYVIILLFFINSCDGQNHKCNSDLAIKKISKLPEIQKQQKYIDSITNHKHGVSYMVDDDNINKKQYFRIKTRYNGELHWETYHIFYVEKKTCSLYYYDTVSGNLLTIEQWRNKSKKPKNTNMEDIEFSNLFNEGTNIKFTPKDLNKSNPEIEEFKKKLLLYEDQHPLPEDFEIENLKSLINNEAFFDLQYYTNSSWLQYFITKYKIDVTQLKDLMSQAINQEDYNAVKILVDSHYIVSEKELQIASETEQESKNKIQENKIDGYESYLVSESRINQISSLLKAKFRLNKINDPDGFTNLRKDKNTSSEVLQKIKSGERIEVLDNIGDWYLIKTKEGKQGYMHKSRIKSN